MLPLRLLAASLLALSACAAAEWKCDCGANPPGPPPTRVVAPYANEPEDMRPYSKFTKPYYEHYTKTVEYNGAARDARTIPPSEVSEVRISFLGPIKDHKDIKLGTAMLNGAQMAVDEANAHGGYGGKPFKLIVHNDGALWGSSSNENVKMVYDDDAWAMLGSISGDSTHIALRVSLRSELPMVNSASTDPTIPETIIPWILTSIQDDRVQCYTLARHIYTELGLKRIALLRVNERYGRFGVGKFKDASRRLGHPLIIEQKYMPGDKDFTRQLRVISDSRVDGIVLWGDADAAGMILKQARELGMKQPFFGSHRTLEADLYRMAGPAAEGFEAVYPYDPTRDDPAWVDFQKRFRAKYNADVDNFSALGFDTMNVLLHSICRAGLNKGKIRDALYGLESYKGVTGEMVFDPNAKNVAPMYLATVKDGKATYRRATMDLPYAKTADAAGPFNGPPTPDLKTAETIIGVFGPDAPAIVSTLKVPGAKLVPIDSKLSWGKASTEIVNLVYEGNAAALLATDRNSAHLAEQIGSKVFVPVVALSNDHALTSTNVRWIFRLPAETPVNAAVNCIVEAAGKSGQNRGRLRDVLASGEPFGGYRFDGTGEVTVASK